MLDAGATRTSVTVDEDEVLDRLTIRVDDDSPDFIASVRNELERGLLRIGRT